MLATAPALDAAHVVIALYFLYRLLTVDPFLPPPRPHQNRQPLLYVIVIAVVLSVPIVITAAPFTHPFFAASWLLASLVALRFSYNAPLFEYPTNRPRLLHFPRLVLWRIDLLLYVLFVLFTGGLSSLWHSATSVMLTAVLAMLATTITLLDVLLRLQAQQVPISLRTIIASVVSHPQPAAEELSVPPTTYDTSAIMLLTFHWASPTVHTGHQRSLEAPDVMPLADKYCAHVAGNQRFLPFWEEQLRRAPISKPSVFKALFKAFGARLLLGGMLKLVNDVCLFVSPMLLKTVSVL